MAQFTLQQTQAAIDYLFKDLWPMMAGAGERYSDSRNQAEVIQAIINKQPDHDSRIKALKQLHGIGATIASGLLWSFFPEECVPFDKHTMGYCLFDWKIIRDYKITNGTYIRKCQTIIAGLPRHVPSLPQLVDLVRWAGEHRSQEYFPE